MTVRDERRGPWCWQSTGALCHLRRECAPALRLIVLAVYVALTEIANEERARKKDFEATRARIADRACVSAKSVDRAMPELERIGLVHVTRRDAHRLPSIFTIPTRPGEAEPGDSQSHALGTHSRQPGDSQSHALGTHSRTVQEDVSQEQNPLSPKQEFERWLADFRQVTGRGARGSSAAGRLFTARRREWSLEDLKLATRGCQADPWRRENGQVVPEQILKATNVEGFRLAGLERSKPNGSGGDPFVNGSDVLARRSERPQQEAV